MMSRSANRAHAIAGEDIAAPRMLKLIRAAENIFLVKGYHTATMSEVAKAAGMSKKTVYQLVESKADLFSALFAHHDSLLTLPVLPPDWTASEVLTENLLCLGRFLLRPEQIALVRLIVAEHVHDPEFGALFYQKRVLKARSQLELCLAGMARRRGPARQGNARRGVAEMAALLVRPVARRILPRVLAGFSQSAGACDAGKARARRGRDVPARFRLFPGAADQPRVPLTSRRACSSTLSSVSANAKRGVQQSRRRA